MTKPRQHKVSPVSQLQYLKERPKEGEATVKFQADEDGFVRINLGHGKNLFMDSEEAFQTIRALLLTGTKQFGEEWMERVKQYVGQVKVIS
jgi:hypothetical protein